MKRPQNGGKAWINGEVNADSLDLIIPLLPDLAWCVMGPTAGLFPPRNSHSLNLFNRVKAINARSNPLGQLCRGCLDDGCSGRREMDSPIWCLQRAGGEMLLFANIQYFLQIAPRPRPEPPGPVGPDAGATQPTPASFESKQNNECQ